MNLKSACSLMTFVMPLLAQTPPPSILEVQVENVVLYIGDTSDVSKWGTLPGPVALPDRSSGFSATFKHQVMLGDVVSINGQTMRGSFVGRGIADGSIGDQSFLFSLADGTYLGTISVPVTNTPFPPPGAPGTATGGTGVVAGGSGAFLGVRGQAGVIRASGLRAASMTESPAFRRQNGGGKITFFLQLMPAVVPEILTLPGGLAVYHSSDLSPVTTDAPARAGEQLTARAYGLGPVRPQLDPGTPYPGGTLHEVISPVGATVNGKAATVVNQIGWPGTTGVYRVDFVVPSDTTAGMAAVSLIAAFINGPEVRIPVR